MNERKNKIIIGIVSIVFILWAAVSLYALSGIFRPRDHRVVQILKSPDKARDAQLVWFYGAFDLNFRIYLNNERIYMSPDFRPNYSVPYRETLLWDQTSRYLLLEIAGQRLWGYDVLTKKPLSEDEIQRVKIVSPELEEYGYSGQWPKAAS